jgi:threonine dehydratase
MSLVPAEPPPDLPGIRATRARLGDLVVTTPVREWGDPALEREAGRGTRVFLKEELFQRTGTFKPRGALAVMLDLPKDALARGVTAVSAGNHAIAVAYAAQALGSTAKVVMPKNANPFRVAKCRDLGAEIDLVEDVHRAFERVKQIEAAEGRTFVHPFEGPRTARAPPPRSGAHGAGARPGGGGGAHRRGRVVRGGRVRGEADARSAACTAWNRRARLHAPQPPPARPGHRRGAHDRGQSWARRTPHCHFTLCRRYVDELVLVSDDALRRAMLLLFASAKLRSSRRARPHRRPRRALHERLAGRRVGSSSASANIDAATFSPTSRR